MTCLGCGGVACQVCEDRARKVIEQSHWPLETSVSRAALEHIALLIREFQREPSVRAELDNLHSLIRAHLQHHPVPTFSTDEDSSWLE